VENSADAEKVLPGNGGKRMRSVLLERVPRHLRKHLAFPCPKCHSWLFLTRDLVEDRISLETGIQYRRFVCDSCRRVFEFEGRRGIQFTRKGVRLSHRVRIVIPPELRELIAFKRNLERVLRMKPKP